MNRSTKAVSEDLKLGPRKFGNARYLRKISDCRGAFSGLVLFILSFVRSAARLTRALAHLRAQCTERLERSQERRNPRLACAVAGQVSGKNRDEFWSGDELSDSAPYVRAKRGRCPFQLVNH